MMSSMAIELTSITMINFIEKLYNLCSDYNYYFYNHLRKREKSAPASIYIAIVSPIFWTFLKGVILKVL